MILEKNTIKEICLYKVKDEWITAKTSFPIFLSEVSIEIKEKNEMDIQEFSDNFRKQLNLFSHRPFFRKKWKHKTLTILEDFLNTETVIGIHHSMNQQSLNSFQDELKDFLRHVRQFAPELSIEGIGQAIRNYIVYAMFNEINQMKPGFNNASFGYSMLYPFTDNFIDSEEYSWEEKKDYNQMIKDKIEGKEVHPKSDHHQKTCDLLQAIESEYPRDKDTTIFTLLLMMLEAQEDSLRQQNKGILLTAKERLDISLYKGGISVLIDRFFVKKELTEEDLFFYFSFGFFLQLADDLQDIKEDSTQCNQTIFTTDLHCVKQEQIVNKMLHFIHRIMESYHAENDIFKDFILTNCYQLIYSSVTTSKDFFSKDYLEKLEPYLPVTYSFLEKMKNNQGNNKTNINKSKYMKILDELI